MKIAIYPGSFDPITNGHLDIVERAAKQYEKIIVAPLPNSKKKQPLFDIRDRIKLIQEATKHIGNVEVQTFSGLLINFYREIGASAVIKGLRAVTDFEYELQMAYTNAYLDSGFESVFMMASQKYTFLSSSIVKEISSYGGDVAGLVPPNVNEALKKAWS